MDESKGFKASTSDGFTVQSDPRGGLNYFLRGERWPGPYERFEPATLIESLAKEIERLSGGGVAQSAVSPIGQSDVAMLNQLADGMGSGRTHDMLRRVIAACPYLVSSTNSPEQDSASAGLQSQSGINQSLSESAPREGVSLSSVGAVAWRYRNEYNEVVSEWIDGPPPEYMRDANTDERIAVSTMKIDVAYSRPEAGERAQFMQQIVTLRNYIARLEIAALAAPPSVALDELADKLDTLASTLNVGKNLEVWVASSDHELIRKAARALRAAAPPSVALEAGPSAEDIARTICLSYGRDPDAMTSALEMCDANNRPVAIWHVYEEQAEAILAAYPSALTRPQPGDVVAENERGGV